VWKSFGAGAVRVGRSSAIKTGSRDGRKPQYIRTLLSAPQGVIQNRRVANAKAVNLSRTLLPAPLAARGWCFSSHTTSKSGGDDVAGAFLVCWAARLYTFAYAQPSRRGEGRYGENLTVFRHTQSGDSEAAARKRYRRSISNRWAADGH